ncbi:hypothetical protein B0H17DRAFT_1326281 [Mycena rosella]|uniref:Zn(2)-C6 fungal-type domain-containing protein n=1 Tax=Mycena rosella TaxID=1033263 RepID=A0AAD7GUC6_MYCRO|nr:hypothetical protein B0H17DRAFT_1326281 [Mycena rosella]
MPSPQPPEKNKKVSRACNTCRLKRKKCDGLEPCIFCTETKVECSYSREPRRRGPPSGYLRYTETRVALLETMLGLFIQTSGPQSTHTLHDAAQTLRAESKTHTQDVWDAYKQVWTDCDAARAVQELVTTFAPFAPADNQTPTAKALLPPAGKQQPPRSPSPVPVNAGFSYTNESFERTHEPASTSNQLPPRHDLGRAAESNTSADVARMVGLGMHSAPMDDLPMPMFLPSPPAHSATPSAYPGAYWRTAALASPSPPFTSVPLPLSPTMAGFTNYLTASLAATAAPTPIPADLPPLHVRSTLLATYRAAVHPSLPILSPGQTAAFSAPDAAPADSPMLLLALCAYTARLAPPSASPTRVAADLWYESAAALLTAALRRAAITTDTVQTLLLLALRDHGRGRDAQAWRGVGAAVRVAQELGLDGEIKDDGGGTAKEDGPWARGLWGVASMMDLFLSIQLGRAPATAEALRPLAPPSSSTNGNTSLPSPASTSTPASTYASASASNNTDVGGDDGNPDAALFVHTLALVRIVARVHFWLGLGYGSMEGSTDSTSTDGLATELAAWHRSLPARFRVALGGERVPRAVLEAHMLYQVGVGMLGRGRLSSNGSGPGSGFSNGNAGFGNGNGNGSSSTGFGGGTGTYAADDAASTFNVLLDKYRPSLALAGPHVVWLVFAAARATLGGAGSGAGSGAGTARALQTQLHLLNCREALAGMGGTWELARRCARTLERLMNGDSAPGASGKRKREDEDGGEPRKRQDVDEGGGAGWGAGPGGEAFDFEAAGWGAEFESGLGMGMGVGMNVGMWEGTWDEGLWGRGAFGGGGAGPGFGMGLGLGLFDAPPGG